MARVPKWGNFDDQVPYTVYFDKARRDKGGNRVPNLNPALSEQPPLADLPLRQLRNDPPKNPGLVSPHLVAQRREESELGRPTDPPGQINPAGRSGGHDRAPRQIPADVPPREIPNGPPKIPVLNPPPLVARRREESEAKRPTDSPSQIDHFGRRTPDRSRLNSGDPVSRAQRGNGEFDWAPGQTPTDIPPLELPNDPRKNPGLVAPPPAGRRREDQVPRESGRPDWAPERTPPHPLHKGAPLDSGASTQGVPPYASPAQPRARPSVHDANNNYGVGAAVPKFGDWDNNPAAADGYTCRFGQIRDARQGKATLPPIIRTEPSPYREYEQPSTTRRSSKMCSIL